MQVGCGVTTKTIRGRPYLYFWHYEDRGGRRTQVYRYMGSPRSEVARRRLAEAIEDYFDRLATELRHRRSELLARAALP